MINTDPRVDQLVQDRPPNSRDEDGRLFLVYCFNCNNLNRPMYYKTGKCCYCGWSEHDDGEVQ